MRVAVYTCALNEALSAERWAASTKGADYRLWLDTGSTDDTPTVAHQNGIVVRNAFIEPFRFDVARNTALSLLPSDIDICIQLDADEVLSEGWRAELEETWEKLGGHSQFSCRLLNEGTGTWGQVIRQNIHARRGFHWVHPVHETLATHYTNPIVHLPNVTIHHQPDPEKSREPYLWLLELAVREQPLSDRMAFYYARELMYRGDWNAARREFERHLSLPTAAWDAERAESLRFLASIDHYPERWLLRAIATCPERREPWVDLAKWYRDHDRYIEAKGAIHSASLRQDRGLYTTEAYAWDDEFIALYKEIYDA